MKSKKWEIVIDEVKYSVEFCRSLFSKNLRVNGQDVPLEKSNPITGSNETHFMLGTKSVVFVHVGNKMDLVLNGKYLTSGEEYVPLPPMPKWAWIFIILNGLIIITVCGGIVGLTLSLLGILFCMLTCQSVKIKATSRLSFCILITVANYSLALYGASLAIRAGIR